MTYEELYKSALEEYSRKWESYFSQFQVRDYKNMNIIQMQEELDSRKAQLAKLEAEKPPSFDFISKHWSSSSSSRWRLMLEQSRESGKSTRMPVPSSCSVMPMPWRQQSKKRRTLSLA